MVEGLTFFSNPPMGSWKGWRHHHRVVGDGSVAVTAGIEVLTPVAGHRADHPITSSRHDHTHEILVTQAERPHPFPSRTRKLSSPAPKILRGQPLGKIGRRRGLLRFGVTL
jgi:hypothetical protein